MPKRRKVPEVLWRLFKERARTLVDTILSLINPSRTLQWSPMLAHQFNVQTRASFLVRHGDPADYVNLLNHCIVVLNEDAPTIMEFHPRNVWPQSQIVTRVIQLKMDEQATSPNVICSGYDKYCQSSCMSELLTSSSWILLLERVGDAIMIHLLKHASIFVPLPHKNHQQVTGPPINKLFRWKSGFAQASQGSRKMAGGVHNAIQFLEKQAHNSSSVNGSICYVACVGCNSSYCAWSRINPFVMGKNRSITDFSREITLIGDNAEKRVGHSSKQIHASDHIIAPSRKRSRPFKWQRQKKFRHTSVMQTRDVAYGTSNSIESSSHFYMPRQCSCCLLLRALLVQKNVQINRQAVFYNMEHSSSVFPQKHIINFLRPNLDGAKALIRSIFGISNDNTIAPPLHCTHSRGFCLIGSTCLYHLLIKKLKILIRRARSCNHLRLLDKHCAVSPLNQTNAHDSGFSPDEQSTTERLCLSCRDADVEQCRKHLESTNFMIHTVKSSCSKSRVVSFIWAVCRNMVPIDLLGSPSNWRALRRNIGRFVMLRRYEKFSVRQCMHKLKSSGFKFLSDRHSWCYADPQVFEDARADCLKHILLERWISWLFSSLVVPLLRSNFYVTENEHGKQEVFYYRKSIWKILKDRAFDCFVDRHFKPLDETGVRRVIRNRSFGFSKARFLPKENGLRLLANLRASSRITSEDYSPHLRSFRIKKKITSTKSVKFLYFKPVNRVLRSVHAALKGIQLKEPKHLGLSVFDYNDIYRKLCPFIVALKNESTPFPDVFIVVSDVSNAFDSIHHDKLLGIMKDVVGEDEYVLDHSCEVVSARKSLLMNEKLSCPIVKKFSSCSYGSRHTVLVSKGLHGYIKREDILFNLKEHVKYNVLQFDDKFCLQGMGIPQGSVLSSLLCSFYYGHLETNVIIPFLLKIQHPAAENLSRSHGGQHASVAGSSSMDKLVSSGCYLLLRLIDDFIFISTSKTLSSSFYSRLRRGFRDYNCYMNERKFGLNFDVADESVLLSNRVYVGDDGIPFLRWSGLFVNCSTLEVQGDYTRYLTQHLSVSLTVCWVGRASRHLREKLCSFMRPKCHPIFFDSNINSAAVVRLNIYQSFLLCAMKFHCHVSVMSYLCKLKARSHMKIIERTFRYLYARIKKKMRPTCLVSSTSSSSSIQPILRLEVAEVEWLGLYAYIQVLDRKQARHKELLYLLRSKLLNHEISLRLSSPMKYAADRSHSSLLWKIKY